MRIAVVWNDRPVDILTGAVYCLWTFENKAEELGYDIFWEGPYGIIEFGGYLDWKTSPWTLP